MRFLTSGAQKWLNAVNNLNYDMDANGERFVIDRMSLADRVVLDVGANAGLWTRTVKDIYPSARVHCFEIDPDTSLVLERNVGHLDGVTIARLGLSNEPGQMTIHSYPDASVVTSVFDYPHPNPRIAKLVDVTTGDHYVSSAGITEVDFLKIDVEGAEMLVLEGFDEMLANGRVKAIQFEYGWINVVAHVLLRDLYEFLEVRGYRVGKIYPDGVDFRGYDPHDEDFRGPNYLAVGSQHEELIDLLAAPH